MSPILEMRDWQGDRRVCGYWTHIGGSELQPGLHSDDWPSCLRLRPLSCSRLQAERQAKRYWIVHVPITNRRVIDSNMSIRRSFDFIGLALALLCSQVAQHTPATI